MRLSLYPRPTPCQYLKLSAIITQFSIKSGARTLGSGMVFGIQSKQDLSGFANLTGLCVEGRLILVVGAFLLLIALLMSSPLISYPLHFNKVL